jgi:sugar (pentulose or hexulose) kinase
MDLLLGLDVGTTATKALLLNMDGEVVGSASHSYGLITPREDWVEQDPEDLWSGVVAVCQAVLKHAKPQDRVLALGISAQGGTTIPVDTNGRPVGNAISWMDHRAHQQAEQVRSSLGKDRVYKTTGWLLGDGLPMLHISWLRQCAPELFAAARRFLFVNDFIIYRLTGQLCMDPSDAGITQLYNIAGGRWDDDMLETAGIHSNQLSPVQNSGVAVGQLTAEASRETGLPTSVLVVNGAHDQYCAALGAGVFSSGDVMLSCGTAWVILCLMERLHLTSGSLLAVSPHAIPGKWGALRSLGGVGACMEWVLRCLWSDSPHERSSIYSELNRGVGNVPAGAGGLIFLPSSGGYEFGSRGGFIGLTLSHSRDDMARAVMEGVVYELRRIMGKIREVSPTTWRMVGGAAASSAWSKIVADVTHLPVVIPSTTEAASCGAGILAGVGSGVFHSAQDGYQSLAGREIILEPDEADGERYDELFEIYCSASQEMKHSLARLSNFGDEAEL